MASRENQFLKILHETSLIRDRMRDVENIKCFLS